MRHCGATAALKLDERYAYLEKIKGHEVGGLFDAVSPEINDTYPFNEIQLWLIGEEVAEIRKTVEHPSHFVVARKTA